MAQGVQEIEAKLARLERLFGDIQKGRYSEELLDECPDLKAVLTDIEKCKYRIGIMKRAIDEIQPSGSKDDSKKAKGAEKNAQKGQPSASLNKNAGVATKPNIKYVKVLNYGDSILELLLSVFDETVKKVFPEVDIKLNLRETTQLKFGDYQLDSCPLISKKLSDAGIKMPPAQVAQKIAESLPQLDLVEKFSPVNAFVNVFLNRVVVGKRVATAFQKGVTLPKVEKKKIIIDFSSPNIAKQMHVGHLRSTIIGESLSRLFENADLEVLRLNHIGDWGTQFGMLIAHLQDIFPNYLHETPPIGDLQTFYKESKKLFDEDEAFKKRAYQCVVQLQNGDPDITKAWQMICDVSRKDFLQIYQRLDVTLAERGESFYQSRMVRLVNELEEKGLLKEEEGRKLFWPTGASIPLTVVKSDGGFTYDTSDLATIHNRIFEENADWILYVVDRGQSEHFEGIYAAARDFRWYKPEEKRVEHVQFGVVLGEDRKKFKTRSGDTVRLTDLLDEGVRRAEEKLREKKRDEAMTKEQFEAAKEAVAYGCIKYADLSQSRTNDYVFSFDRMLDDKGNTAVYLLYAYARIRSIGRTAKVEREQIETYVKDLKDGILPLEHDNELKLAKMLLRFSDVLLTVMETLYLHKLCDYVYSLATFFHDFYKTCYVVETQTPDGTPRINYHRLVLCEVTANVMKECFKILGIRPLEIM